MDNIVISKRVAFYTLGCKVNQYETNGMIQKFIEAGYEIVDFDNIADIYIVNTCTVTGISDKKSRMFLRQSKKKNPNSIVIACGCYVQVAKDSIEKIPEIDLCIGTNEKINIIEYVEDFLERKNKNVEISDVFVNKEYCEFGSVTYTEKTRAVIKIQDGCDRFCSYCLIPYARGRVRSRNPQNVVNEVSKIASQGIKEIVLTGIHIASYGKDFENGYKLIDLLEELNNIDGIERIRLGSIEPLLITDEFIERFSKLDKMCHHFHLSLQSGALETLKRMNRRYTPDEFREIVKRIRDVYDDAILTTDVIVGFPGETEEEFNETYEFLKEIKFYKMHIFKFSPRKGTKAEVMPDQISADVKEVRSNKLIELSDNNENEYLNQYVGSEVSVLFEELDNDIYKGHTANYIMVNCSSNEDLTNKIRKVKIEKNEKNQLYGKLL